MISERISTRILIRDACEDIGTCEHRTVADVRLMRRHFSVYPGCIDGHFNWIHVIFGARIHRPHRRETDGTRYRILVLFLRHFQRPPTQNRTQPDLPSRSPGKRAPLTPFIDHSTTNSTMHYDLMCIGHRRHYLYTPLAGTITYQINSLRGLRGTADGTEAGAARRASPRRGSSSRRDRRPPRNRISLSTARPSVMGD